MLRVDDGNMIYEIQLANESWYGTIMPTEVEGASVRTRNWHFTSADRKYVFWIVQDVPTDSLLWLAVYELGVNMRLKNLNNLNNQDNLEENEGAV